MKAACFLTAKFGDHMTISHADSKYRTRVGMWDGHVVTKSDRWVSSGYFGFLPHEDHPNANIGANEHD